MPKWIALILKGLSCMAFYMIVAAFCDWKMPVWGYIIVAFLSLVVWGVIDRFTKPSKKRKGKKQ